MSGPAERAVAGVALQRELGVDIGPADVAYDAGRGDLRFQGAGRLDGDVYFDECVQARCWRQGTDPRFTDWFGDISLRDKDGRREGRLSPDEGPVAANR
jgi:hypothetical protein